MISDQNELLREPVLKKLFDFEDNSQGFYLDLTIIVLRLGKSFGNVGWTCKQQVQVYQLFSK